MDSYEFVLNVDDRIIISGDTVLTLVKTSGSIAKVGIDGPHNVYRGELEVKIEGREGVYQTPIPE